MRHDERLAREALRRFPEIRPDASEQDELPWVLDRVVDWLVTVAKPGLDAAVVKRVLDFDSWCIEQPRGPTAADDIVSMEMVGFIERLFEHDELLPLIPKLLSREDLLRNREHLINWVGVTSYEAALRHFDGVV